MTNEANACRLHLSIDEGLHWHSPAPPVVRVSHSMGVQCANHHLFLLFASRVQWGCTWAATTSAHCPHLEFNGSVVCQPPPLPVVRVSGSMGVYFGSHHLCLSYASRFRWGCASIATTARRSRLAFDAGVFCANHHLRPLFASQDRWGCALVATIPPVVRISHSMEVCFGSHHHPLFASGV